MDIYLIRNRQSYEDCDSDPIEAVFLNMSLAEKYKDIWNKKTSKESFRSPYYLQSIEISGINSRKEQMYREYLKRIEGVGF
jgi:hypothetical protein